MGLKKNGTFLVNVQTLLICEEGNHSTVCVFSEGNIEGNVGNKIKMEAIWAASRNG